MTLPELSRSFAGDLRKRLCEGAEGRITDIGRDVGYPSTLDQQSHRHLNPRLADPALPCQSRLPREQAAERAFGQSGVA
jgi:hypothetical protein